MVLTVSVAALADNGKGVVTDGVATAYGTISSAGPLNQIFVGVDVATQISYITDPDYQVYPEDTIPGDYGTFVVVADVLYAPDFADYDEVWAAIGTHLPFDNTCRCNELIDTGAGISWDFTVPASGNVTYSHYSVFSPTGGPPPQEEAIPTLSPFGIAVFVGLLVMIGLFVVRRWS